MNRRSTINNRLPDYTEIRSRLLTRGFSLRSFAIHHNYRVPTVYSAARGERAGKISSGIHKHILQFISAK